MGKGFSDLFHPTIVSTLLWLKSYLSQRKYDCGAWSSIIQDITAGIPQGKSPRANHLQAALSAVRSEVEIFTDDYIILQGMKTMPAGNKVCDTIQA